MIAGALSAALVFAQGRGSDGAPPDPATAAQMRVSHLTSGLSLTDSQQAQATAIFTNALTHSQNLHASLKANRQSLADAVKKNDTASIDQLSAAAGTLDGQLTAIEAKANAAVYAMLTPDQQAKFDAMPHGGPRGGGPGAGAFGLARAPRARQ